VIGELEEAVSDYKNVISEQEHRINALVSKLNNAPTASTLVFEPSMFVPAGIKTSIDDVPMPAMTITAAPKHGGTWGKGNMKHRVAKAKGQREAEKLMKEKRKKSGDYTDLAQKGRAIAQDLLSRKPHGLRSKGQALLQSTEQLEGSMKRAEEELEKADQLRNSNDEKAKIANERALRACKVESRVAGESLQGLLGGYAWPILSLARVMLDRWDMSSCARVVQRWFAKIHVERRERIVQEPWEEKIAAAILAQKAVGYADLERARGEAAGALAHLAKVGQQEVERTQGVVIFSTVSVQIAQRQFRLYARIQMWKSRARYEIDLASQHRAAALAKFALESKLVDCRKRTEEQLFSITDLENKLVNAKEQYAELDEQLTNQLRTAGVEITVGQEKILAQSREREGLLQRVNTGQDELATAQQGRIQAQMAAETKRLAAERTQRDEARIGSLYEEAVEALEEELNTTERWPAAVCHPPP